MKLDVLAFGAHPDDVELGCGGILAQMAMDGNKIGIVDLTRGELGTRGTAETRDQEAKDAAEILGCKVRENLNFADGFFTNDREHQLKVIAMIRKYQPEICIINAPSDRHPDHGKGSALLVDSIFLSGLRKIETLDDNGGSQEAWRPKQTYHYIQFVNLKPELIMAFSAEAMKKKMDAVRAYATQFYDPNSDEPETVISKPQFLQSIEFRAIDTARLIGAEYAEGFVCQRAPAAHSFFDLI